MNHFVVRGLTMTKKICGDLTHARIRGESKCRICDASVAREETIKVKDEEE
jgi:hypothetical protein